MTEGIDSFVLDSYAEKRKQIRICVMKWQCLLVRAVWGCGVGTAEGSPGHGGAAVAALASVVPRIVHRCSGGPGMLSKVWKLFLAWGYSGVGRADLTLPLKEVLRRCPSRQAHGAM